MGAIVTLRERHERKLAAYRASVEVLILQLGEYARAHGGRFILFGSAARGTPHDESDVDLLVDFAENESLAACRFAEELCWSLELKPDVLDIAWASERVTQRARQEGVVLGEAVAS